jgi:hypothetical protein
MLYLERVTFFQGNSAASPERTAGYNFDVTWRSPQISIVNSSIFYTISRTYSPKFLNFMASVVSTSHSFGTININPSNGSEILNIMMNVVLLKNCEGTARLILVCKNSMK